MEQRSSFGSPFTDNLLPKTSMNYLSQCAKKQVNKQYNLWREATTSPSRLYNRRPVTNVHKTRPAYKREISSAPANIVPKIVVKEPSTCSNRSSNTGNKNSQLYSRRNTSREKTINEKNDELVGTLKSVENWMQESPISILQPKSQRRYSLYFTQPAWHFSSTPRQQKDKPGSPTKGIDEWEAQRLSSRQSTIRADSALTFDDFLEELDPDSDEYDTDLEDERYAYVKPGIENEDPHLFYQSLYDSQQNFTGRLMINKLQNTVPHFALTHRYPRKHEAMAIIKCLRNNKYVRSVDLSSNRLTCKMANYLINFVRENKAIQRLDVSSNCLHTSSKYHFKYFIISAVTLTHLNISKNDLEDKEGLLLCNALQKNKSLIYLDVSHNNLTDCTGEALGSVLVNNDCLESINFSWNKFGRKSGTAFANMLMNNSTIVSIDLSWNGIGDDGAAIFGACLKQNSTLRFLSLAVNHICASGAEKLASGISGSIKTKSKLEYLNLSNNPLGPAGLKILLEHFQKSNVLNELNIEYVILNPIILTFIHQLMKNNSEKYLRFDGQNEYKIKKMNIQKAIHKLNKALEVHKTNIISVLRNINKKQNISLEEIYIAVSHLSTKLSELEVQEALQRLDINKDGIIRIKNIVKFS